MDSMPKESVDLGAFGMAEFARLCATHNLTTMRDAALRTYPLPGMVVYFICLPDGVHVFNNSSHVHNSWPQFAEIYPEEVCSMVARLETPCVVRFSGIDR